MTIREYISQKYASLGLALSEADLVDMGFMSPDEDVTSLNKESIQKGFVSSIPSLLLRPQSVSEGGVAITRAQKQDIEAYYKAECKKLGLYDSLTPKVRFI